MSDLLRIDNPLTALIRKNYAQVLERISQEAANVGRDPKEIRVVVVSKGQPVNTIRAAISVGAKILGENYAEQALTKIEALQDHKNVEWHMIGHVQSRKARIVSAHFALVHSLDSLKLAKRLNQCAQESRRKLPVLLEFNLGDEPSKAGWRAADNQQLMEIYPEIEQILALEYLEVQGLMTMPPLFDDPEEARPFFQKLRDFRDGLSRQFPQVSWQELSMGTSVDYPVAVQEGATLVRVGQAILGPRPAQN